jgi:hypothetical protein
VIVQFNDSSNELDLRNAVQMPLKFEELLAHQIGYELIPVVQSAIQIKEDGFNQTIPGTTGARHSRGV